MYVESCKFKLVQSKQDLRLNYNKCISYRSPRSMFQPGTQVTYTSVNVIFANFWYDGDTVILNFFPEALQNHKRCLSYRSPRSTFQPGTQVTYTSANGVGVKLATSMYIENCKLYNQERDCRLNYKRYLSYRSPRSTLQPGTQVTYTSANGVVWLLISMFTGSCKFKLEQSMANKSFPS